MSELKARFTIVIPVKEINDYVRETVLYIQALDSRNWELIIVPNNDDLNEWKDDFRISLVPSGRVGPADKRDQAAKIASGSILVFLDDDSYPKSDLLSIAEKYFDDKSISAIGGPAVTPDSDSYWQKVSGAVFLSKLTGGNPERYISLGSTKEIDDWPAVNFMVRKTDFLEVGGFNSPFWPGEDTYFCLKLFKNTKRIVYAPDLIVWHHRRSGILHHSKQVGAYGLHRGYFARRFPDTSFKVKYFIPSGLCGLILLSLISPILSELFRNIVIIGWAIYLFSIALGCFFLAKLASAKIAIGAVPFVIVTHLSYGFNFIRGFTRIRPLVSKLR